MFKLNQYAFDIEGNKITWGQWYAQVRGESYVESLSKKGGYFCFDGTHEFESLTGSHLLYALPSHLQQGQGSRGACDTAALAAVATPTNNMGVKSPEAMTVQLVINDKGEVVEVPVRMGHGDDAAFIDWLNITFHKQTALRYTTKLSGLDNEACVMAISKRLEYLLGFGVTEQRPTGSNFYKESYVLGDKWGQVCVGGQQDTILVMLTGAGCAAAAPGWEDRLFKFLSEEAVQPRITRVDLTFDDIEGALYSVDQARQDHLDGKFTTRGKPPSGENLGDWDNPNGRGRTKTVGVRASGKYLRVYEKGMQLGCKFHPWCRVELEMKSTQMCIPFDVLLKAGAYLSASYPALHWISEQKAERPKTKQKELEVNVNKAIEIVRLQFGNYINALTQLFGADNVLSMITRNDKIPERLKVKDYKFAPLSMHKDEYQYLDTDAIIDLTDVPAAEVEALKADYKYDDLAESWLPSFCAKESLREFQKEMKLGDYADCPF